MHFIAIVAILYWLLTRRFICRFYAMNRNYFAGIILSGARSLPESCFFFRAEAISNILLGIILFFLDEIEKMPNYT